jgi:transcriptional regulator with XRE-family HTH domain
MDSTEENNHFTVLENKTIGRNLLLFRKLRDKKAFEVADYIGIGESAYTKYERGESKITVELIQKVAEFLKVDPLMLLSAQPGQFIENVHDSTITGAGSYIGGNFQTCDAKQTEMMLNLMEKVIELLEKNK